MKTQIPKSISEKELLDESPAYFARRVFGYLVKPHHQAMLNHIQSAPQVLCLSPRGHGKSRICNIAYNAWLCVTRPESRILIISDTDRHSIRFLQTIKNVLERSPVIKRNYGDVVGTKNWTDHSITTTLRQNDSISEASITALGALSGQATSGHWDYECIDDIVNFESTRSAVQRERIKSWFLTTLMPTVLPGGSIYAIGTRYHFDDIYNVFIDDLGFKTLIQPAISDEGTESERALWEEHRPLDSRIINGRKVKGLKEIKADIGSLIFGLQYMNNCELQRSGSIFKWEWFNFYREEDLPKRLKIYQAADLAISKKDTADYFVIVTIGIDELGNVYLLDIYRRRGLSFRAQVEAVIKKAEEWKPLKIAIESNAYQAALAQEVERLSLLPVIELTTTKDKVLRGQMRSGLVESGRVFVKQHMHDFVSELTLFPDSDHDDQFDAFDFALTVAETKDSDAIQEGYFQPEFDLNAVIY